MDGSAAPATGAYEAGLPWQGSGIPLIERWALHRIFCSMDEASLTHDPAKRSPPASSVLRGVSLSYVLGAMHDGTVRRRTIRISQREESYVCFLLELIEANGGRAWTYREGKQRNLYVVEFSRTWMASHSLRTRRDRIDYFRGYFDAEGGLPEDPGNQPYLTSPRRISSICSSFGACSAVLGLPVVACKTRV